ncbi:hypothetical protein EC988_003537 [Linderina pennispora]|nr:hypothetical protein EC988_003537 [Linderina pennispora]
MPDLFRTDDSDLDYLLSQAKDVLTEKEQTDAAAQKTEKKHSKDTAPAALAVQLRLDANTASELPLIHTNPFGPAKLDPTKLYSADSSTSSRLQAAEKCDPTIKKKLPHEIQKEREQTTGRKWFNMKAPVLTDAIKNDLRVLQLRGVLDPKRFYKKEAVGKKLPKYFEMGTVVEDASEFYSARLTRKERRGNLVDELLADKDARSYFKQKVGDIHRKNVNGGKSWYKKQLGGKKHGGVSKRRH